MLSLSQYVGDGFLVDLHVRYDAPTAITCLISQRMENPARLYRVRFGDVAAFHLGHGEPNSLLFDIEQLELITFVESFRGMLDKGKHYHWPVQFDTIEDLPDVLRRAHLMAFEIQSKTGTDGWILCRSLRLEAVGPTNEMHHLLVSLP